MYSKYYQDELDSLRELGREFARENPEIAHFLDDTGSDPDVARLLEGVAFLTGRIRQKLDDELPEVIHTLMGLLWPHYLRPVPSLTMIEFTPREHLSGRETIPRWATEIDSVPVEGTRCRFRTCYDVEIMPLAVEDVRLESPAGAPAELRVRLRALGPTPIAQFGLERLRFHVFGEAPMARSLYGWLCRHTREIEVRSDTGTVFRPGAAALQQVGFGESESLWPCPPHVFPGYRLLQEYFALPAKFLFIDVAGLAALASSGADRACTLIFRMARPPEATLRVTAESLRLYCTPAANLFAHTADPLHVDQRKTEYTVRPAGDPAHYEVYSVDQVVGMVRGSSERRTYLPLYSFRHGTTPEQQEIYHHTRLRTAIATANSITTIAFLSAAAGAVVPPTETISLDLTCTNRKLAESLRVRDLTMATDTAPAFASFANIAPVTPSVVPPLDGDLHWRLISHLALNYLSISSVAALRTMLELYNVPALYDRQAARANEMRLDSITGVDCVATDRLVRGLPVRGSQLQIDIRQEGFLGEGDVYLFGSVLNEFLALYATLNSFMLLRMRDSSGEKYEWPMRVGSQLLV